MEILKFDNAPQSPRKSKKKGSSNLKVMTALASVAAVAVLGSTLAANISLGSGSLEFGQGVQLTAACDSDGLTVSPGAAFQNGAGAAAVFNFKTIALSGIDFSSSTACIGKTFSLSAYDSTTATPLTIATYGASTAVTQVTFAVQSGVSATLSNGITSSGLTGSGTSGAITLALTTPAATAGAVYKLTLQTS